VHAQCLALEAILKDAEGIGHSIAKVCLAIDCVCGVSTENLARYLGEGGTLANCGAMSGERCLISPRYFLLRDAALRGFWLSQWFKRVWAAHATGQYSYKQIADHDGVRFTTVGRGVRSAKTRG